MPTSDTERPAQPDTQTPDAVSPSDAIENFKDVTAPARLAIRQLTPADLTVADWERTIDGLYVAAKELASAADELIDTPLAREPGQRRPGWVRSEMDAQRVQWALEAVIRRGALLEMALDLWGRGEPLAHAMEAVEAFVNELRAIADEALANNYVEPWVRDYLGETKRPAVPAAGKETADA